METKTKAHKMEMETEMLILMKRTEIKMEI